MTWQHALQIDADGSIPQQFDHLAETLLNRVVLIAGEQRYRFTELEFYYDGGDHVDPFIHGDELQRTSGRWYFHRRGGAYVGGSFKGLDITIGDGTAHGGALIRGMQADTTAIDGPCRCVESLLDATGYAHVRELDEALGSRSIWQPGGPMHVAPDESPAREVFYTARVGLTLKRYTPGCQKDRYLMAPYRALSTPRATKKGRVYLITALHRAGRDVGPICALTGSPKRAVAAAIAQFQDGFDSGEFAPYIDKTLSSGDLARLHGIWSRHFGDEPAPR